MEMTKEDYASILKKQADGKLTLFIDTASFRSFFTIIDSKKIKDVIGEPLKLEIYVIRSFVYIFEPLLVLVTIVSSIFLFKWLSIFMVPLVFITWSILKGIFSTGRQTITTNLILFFVGVLVALLYSNLGIWFILFAIGLPGMFLVSKALYYFSWIFGFSLIHRNYEFFKLFFNNTNPVAPIIWAQDN